MVGFEEAEALTTVLRAIVDGAIAWSTPAEIAEALEWETAYVIECLTELVSMGLAEPIGDGYTLSLLSSESYNVEIEECGLIGRGRWIDRDSIGRRRPNRRAAALYHDPSAEVLDREPSPLEQAITAEESWRPRHHVGGSLRKPSVLLVGCAIVWREVKPRERADCCTCKGLPMRSNVYCLRCDRWGLDGVVGRARAAQMLADAKKHA